LDPLRRLAFNAHACDLLHARLFTYNYRRLCFAWQRSVWRWQLDDGSGGRIAVPA
jgi:hypothetical protein